MTNGNTNSNSDGTEVEEGGGILGSLPPVALLAAGAVVLAALFLFASSSSSSSSSDSSSKKAPAAKASKSKPKSKAKSAAPAGGGGGANKGGKGKKKKSKAKAAPATAPIKTAPVPEPKAAEPEPKSEPKAVQFEEKPEPEPETEPETKPETKRKRKKKKNKPANNGGSSSAAAAPAAAAALAANTASTTGAGAGSGAGADTTASDEALAREMQQQFNAEAGSSSPTAVADDGWAVAGQAAKKKKKKKKKAAPKPAPEEAAPATAAVAAGTAAEEAPPAKAEASVSVQIDAKKAGIVIGPKGSTMQAIEAALDVKLDINAPARDDPKPSPFATVIITADEANTGGIARAKSAIKELCTKGYTAITEAPGFCEQYVSVHPRCLAEIVGPGGKNIKALQSGLDIKITIPKTEWNPRDPDPKIGNCRVGLAGNRENCIAGKKAIQELTRYHHTELTHPGWTHEEKEVPQDFFHCIIGRGGSEIKHIRGNFQAEVYLPNAESHSSNVVVVGTPENVKRAVAHIDNLVEREISNRERKFDDDDDVDDEAWTGEGDDSAW